MTMMPPYAVTGWERALEINCPFSLLATEQVSWSHSQTLWLHGFQEDISIASATAYVEYSAGISFRKIADSTKYLWF